MENRILCSSGNLYSVKLDESLQLNRKNAEIITRMKVQSFLFSMRPLKKYFAIVVGVAWGVVCRQPYHSSF